MSSNISPTASSLGTTGPPLIDPESGATITKAKSIHYAPSSNSHQGQSSDNKVKRTFTPKMNRLEAIRAIASNSSSEFNESEFDWGSSSMGAEPGIDASKAEFNNMVGPSAIQVIDWSIDRVLERRFEGPDFIKWFQSGEFNNRPKWAKGRWINVDGLNWKVIQAIALQFELHPLALEDAIKYAAHAHSKVDWYADQLFTRLQIHTLCKHDSLHQSSHPPNPSFFDPLLRLFNMNTSKRQARDFILGESEGFPRNWKQRTRSGFLSGGARNGVDMIDAEADGQLEQEEEAEEDSKAEELEAENEWDDRLEEQMAARAVVHHLTEHYRVQIHKQQLSTFLLPHGTLISVYTHSGATINASIAKRIHTPGTLLRTTEDCSMLLHAILDNTVDQCLEIAEEFRRELDILEGRALVNPDITAVRHLHVLSGQLLMLKRTLAPLQNLIVSLRQDDRERTRVARLVGGYGNESSRVAGYISREANIYLADVNDHIDSVLSSLEMFSNMATSIVDFIFNTMSFSSNESMKWLTFISIIFLPLGFLTGYFGMNFTVFPDIGVFGDSQDTWGSNPGGNIGYFWKITGPLLAVLCACILMANFGQYLKIFDVFMTVLLRPSKDLIDIYSNYMLLIYSLRDTGSTVLGWSRRGLHRLERYKHHKIIKGLKRSKTSSSRSSGTRR
ncbi:Mg2 transporter protein, CorA-like/Zinc transport protein ZntB [Phaffia rhodozyma]|uniref:Mg2 transporter protein, CorA-like/Zinc transport protein ZntB n=1 Tax=Phaffia rhodozyma TaxID=264483 RepID=A0A0F7SKN3_PHARH|nr:Mg2 transporter protein, CorA-like/Zinc transport protein ZntB [Phaffia rhodozyma]